MAAPVEGSGSALIPVVEIEDRPAHSWRGLLIDVARHFIPMDTVLDLLPLCAAVKINVLHIHLTDDQGWRYESVAHPELNRPASTGGDFYSQAEVKKLVAAAHSLGVRVVPELNFPAHTDAAFIAFPWLGSKRITSINPKWGKHDTCAVPGDQTWALVDTIFEELATLFPDEYVHIGGAPASQPARASHSRLIAVTTVTSFSLCDRPELKEPMRLSDRW
jgi:hexosaminidase